jgi:transcriptional regulator with XRE-family HTH domain
LYIKGVNKSILDLPAIDTFYSELGEVIKTARLNRKINQEELGQYLGLTRSSIINLEKGRHRPSLYQILQMAAFFGIEYTKLIPVKLENTTYKSNAELKELSESILDPNEFTDSDRSAVMDFLSSIKK